ncbi:putative oligopeptidase A [Rosa chinensis]|uniref:Putative oligopeptidase A n=1 Tax=Rosa chinensis TaxID=74649 RepID=A0A2P6PG74_ROSCH|nr:putative oligopeptidase A [Rosa chinensis]
MIELGAEVTWSTIVLPFEKIVERLTKPCEIVCLLKNLKHSEKLRDALKEVLPLKVSFDMKLTQSKAIYKAFKSIRESHDWETMSDAWKRIVEWHIKESDLAGINLDDAKREYLRDIEQKLEDQYKKFEENVLDATEATQMLVIEVGNVLGLHIGLLQAAAERAILKGHEDATSEKGPWLFTLEDYEQIQMYAENRSFREEVYFALGTCVSTGDLNNTPVIESILSLRLQKAKLLGYNNYAEVSMKTKCATIEKAKNLLEELQNKLWKAGLEEIEELKHIAGEQKAEEAEDFRPWDTAFWTELLLETKVPGYQGTNRYFIYSDVKDALFHLASVMFDIHIAPADGTAPVWHKDVKLYSVSDSHTTVGYIYFDPFSRPEKMGGAATGGFFSRTVDYDMSSRRLPMAYIFCNISQPSKEINQIFMSFDEVRTLFHEFGHAFQHVLTKQDEVLVAGFQKIEQDCVEVPSTFMEKWCYHWDTLRRIAGVQLKRKGKKERRGGNLQPLKDKTPILDTLDEIRTAIVDLELHTSYTPAGSESIHDVYLRPRSVIPVHPGDKSICTWIHIFGGGYEAGMYGYKWSEMFSTDAFSVFEDAGLDNEKVLITKGCEFRDSVLAVGGGKAPEKIFEDFLGRQPTLDALVKHKLSL